MKQENVYRRIETRREFKGPHGPIIVKFDPLRPQAEAHIWRHLPKQDGEQEFVHHHFVCNKISGEWRCESSNHSVQQAEGRRTSRTPSQKIRCDWYETIVGNCKAFERLIEEDHQAQKQIFDSDGGKEEITSVCEYISGATVTFWRSHDWLVREHVTPSGQLWIWPEMASDSIDAMQFHIQKKSKLAPRPKSFLDWED
jgi:hypothetical protein